MAASRLVSGRILSLASANCRHLTCSRLVICGYGSRDFSTSQIVNASAGKHWRTERVVAVGLMAFIPTGLIYPNPVIDYALAVLIPLHNHWGLSSVIVDYVPKSLSGVAKLLLYMISLATFGGLTYLTFNDVGVCNAVRMIWAM